MSQEHIYSDWLSHLFPQEGWWVNYVAHPDLPDEPPLVKRSKGPALKVSGYCRRCNNEWMSQIEERARPILTPMILGQRALLNAEDQEAIALWTSKTALVIQSAEPEPYRWAPDELYDELYRTRAPLSNTQVWIGHRRDEDVGWSRCHSVRRNDASGGGFGLILAVGHLVIYFVWQDAPGYYLKLAGDLRGSFVQVWPVKRSRRAWPGLASLGSGDLSWVAEAFALNTQWEAA